MLSRLKKWIVSNKVLLVTGIIYTILVAGSMLLIFSLLPKDTQLVNSTEIPEVKSIKDVNDKTVSLIEQYKAERDANKHTIDSLSEALKIRPQQIKSIDRYITVVDTLWRDKVIYIPAKDSSDSTVIRRSDPYIDIVAVGKPKGSYINFKLTPDTLTRLEVERTPFFGRPSTTVYLRHSNIYFHTPQGSSITMSQKEPLFSIGISLGYDLVNKKISFGPTISKPIKTFYKKK